MNINKTKNMNTKKWLQKKLKHSQFDGIIHYGNDGEKKINLISLLNDFKEDHSISMEEILNEAQRRKSKHSVQFADYSLDTWTVANDLLEHRKNALLNDGSVRKIRIEYEM